MLNHPYARFLGSVERPGRYVGGEFGSVVSGEGVRAHMALAFPDAYEIGMSHIGLSILYQILNQVEGVCAERVFMPWPDMEKVLVDNHLPLVSLESARPLSDFQVVGFSLQYELTYTNLVAMLDLGGIPRRAADRGEESPVVIAGGPLAVQCEPVAPFLDLVVVGDGEQVIGDIADILVSGRDEGVGRGELIRRLSALESVFEPGGLSRHRDTVGESMVVTSTQPVARSASVKHLGEFSPGAGPVPSVAAVFDRYSFEIARGCVEGCRFCQAGFLYRPTRERDEGEAKEVAGRAVSCLGFDEVSLAALSSADHSRIEEIITGLGGDLTPRRVSLFVPSLRAYGLSDKLVEVVSRLRATGVTLAPEAGSQRLRDAINKNVTGEDIEGACARFFSHGFRRLKLYFMLGLPGETDEDLTAIIDLTERIRHIGRQKMGGRTPDVIPSVSTFVPRPFTPFEREPMISVDEVRRRQSLLTSLGKARRLDVRLHDPRLSRLEGIFARGDYRMADAIERAVDGGARFDGWGEMFRDDAWKGAFGDLDVDSLLGPVDDDARLPWDHVDVGVSDAFRKKERDRARQFKTTRPCGRYRREEGQAPAFVCHACGAGCEPGDLPIRPVRARVMQTDLEPAKPRQGRPKPRPVKEDPDSRFVRVRLDVAVWGRQAFLGHLDRIKHLARGLRRADLEVRYTQGFHPKPRIESVPPLPLGTAGLAELVDVWLVNPPEESEVLRRLSVAMPGDMEVLSVTELAEGVPKLSRSLEAAEYVALLRAGADRVKEAVAKILAAEAIEVERTRKKKTKVLDVRPFVREAEVVPSKMATWRLPEDPDRTAVRMVLEVPGSGGTRPVEVLTPFLPDASLDTWVVRTGWLLRSS